MADASDTPAAPQPGFRAVSGHIGQNKISFGLWVTRILTVFFTLNYFLPLLVSSATQSYYKALMATAATSALRLHQRLPRVALSREFAATVFMEDSAHYLMYCLIFLFNQPLTMALMPCVLFALLHAASYTLTLVDLLGQNAWWGARMLISFVQLQSTNLLRMAAFTEIFLMPIIVVCIFAGHSTLFTPFVYYRFLTLRYSSRRNPYTRSMFRELRLSIEQLVQSPRVPQALRQLVYRATGFVANLAPAYVANPADQ